MAANGAYLTLWESPEKDLQSLTEAYNAWIDKHRYIFISIGDRLALDIDALSDAYQNLHIYLSIFGSSANGCKKAASLMAALCRHNPIVVRDCARKLTAGEERCLLLINVKAAYEIGEVIARIARHTCADRSPEWNFERQAKFPSIHSYVDFMVNFVKLGCELDKMSEDAADHAITSIALILELGFYHTNPSVAGKSDRNFWEVEISQEPGKLEYGMLNLERNADDHVKVPGGYTPKIVELAKAKLEN